MNKNLSSTVSPPAHLLVVDDQASIRESMLITFRREGYGVETAASGEEAIGILEQKPFDLVITDLRMSGMDGIQVLEKVKEMSPDTEVVVMTAYGHCGSGCMHTKILMDAANPAQWEDAQRAVAEVYAYVREVGGTTSAEHGIGLSKAPEWKKEKADSLEIMKAIKKALDPNNILIPSKLQDAPDNWVKATDLRYKVCN